MLTDDGRRRYARVIRLTEPGTGEGWKARLTEWHGTIPYGGRPHTDQAQDWFIGPIRMCSTPYVTHVEVWWETGNLLAKERPGTRPWGLTDRFGLEIWLREPKPDPLYPEYDQHTDQGEWLRLRYHCAELVGMSTYFGGEWQAQAYPERAKEIGRMSIFRDGKEITV